MELGELTPRILVPIQVCLESRADQSSAVLQPCEFDIPAATQPLSKTSLVWGGNRPGIPRGGTMATTLGGERSEAPGRGRPPLFQPKTKTAARQVFADSMSSLGHGLGSRHPPFLFVHMSWDFPDTATHIHSRTPVSWILLH